MSKPTAADVGRACQACSATKTPVWRTGPHGPKTMCNRCGIKWMRKNPATDRAHTPSSPRKRSNSLGDSDTSGSSSPEPTPRNRSNRKKKADDDYEVSIVEDEESIQEDLPEEFPIKRRKSQQFDDVHTPLSIESTTSSSSCVQMDLIPSVISESDSPAGGDSSPMVTNSDDDISSYRPPSSPLTTTPIVTSTSWSYRPVVPGPTSPFSTPRHRIGATDAYPKHIVESHSLQTIDAHRCVQQIEARISGSFAVSQQCLDLSLRNNITGALLRTLPCNLQTLSLSRCKPLSDSDLLFLPAQLQVLNVSMCHQLTDESLKYLPHSLQSLNVSHCSITDEGLKALPMSLTSLDITMCLQITDEGASALPPLLIRLIMDGCKITNEALRSLPSPLQSLSLQGCQSITDEGLMNLPTNITQLHLGSTLIRSCDGLQYLTNLRHLDLTQCEVSDDSVELLPTSLEWLNMYRCGRITRACIDRLPSNLEFLNLASTPIGALASELKIASSNSNTKIYV